MTNFYKNLVMAGGFLYVFAAGAGALSVDGRRAVEPRRNTAARAMGRNKVPPG